MVVRCIDDDFPEPHTEVVKAILLVGDDHLLPKKGKEYEVIGYGHFSNGQEGYELAEIQTLAYGYNKRLLFLKSRFEIVSDEFVPNAYDKVLGYPCMEYKLYLQMPKFEVDITTKYTKK